MILLPGMDVANKLKRCRMSIQLHVSVLGALATIKKICRVHGKNSALEFGVCDLTDDANMTGHAPEPLSHAASSGSKILRRSIS